MKPRERFLAALRGEAVDRVPLDLPGFQYESAAAIEEVADPLRREIARRHLPESVFFVRVPNQLNRLLATPPGRIGSRTEELGGGRRRTIRTIDTPKGPLGGSEWVTPPMASPAIYDALVQEQERSIIDAIHARGRIAVHIHCHGHVRHALERTIARGADYTEPVEPPPDGDIAMAEAKRLAAGHIALGGNVECRVLCNGSTGEVEAAVRAAFEGGKRRFVLRPTEGPSPRLTDREAANYRRLLDVWEELSPLQTAAARRENAK